jgi:RNA polymerase sigma-70 factor (ECF subfamily)
MLSEKALIQEVKKRNRKALEELHNRYAPVLLGLSLRYCGNRSDAEDVLHDAFIKILSGIKSFDERPNSSFEGWLKRITVNTALNFIRHKTKTNFLVGINPSLEDMQEEQTADDPFLKMGEFLTKDIILQMICELPDGYRTVFNMYVFEEFSHKEIASELNCTENTSKSQLFKARSILKRKILEKVDRLMIESEF